MAASTRSPNGFSYAQAARGQASSVTAHTIPSKVTSGTATPATSNLSELGSSGNWADDVESAPIEKTGDLAKTPQEQVKGSQVRDGVEEHRKLGSENLNGSPQNASPRLTSAPSARTYTDGGMSVVNGTGPESTWETKLQASEPAWIAERKERQISAQNDEQLKAKRGKNDTRDATEPREAKEADEPSSAPPKPVILQEAPPPAINPWAKRMDNAKAKHIAPTVASGSTKEASASSGASNERQLSRSAPDRSIASTTNSVLEAAPAVVPDAKNGKHFAKSRARAFEAKAAVGERTSISVGKSMQAEIRGIANSAADGSAVKDDSAWPTPENAQDKEPKDQSFQRDGKDNEDGVDGEAGNGLKTHQKTKWKPIPVTPSIVWQTEEMNRPRGQTIEKGGRSSNIGRGRGGFRGVPGASKGGDRVHGRNAVPLHESDHPGNQRGRSNTLERESMPPPQKITRQSSANGTFEAKKARDQSTVERTSQLKTLESVRSRDAPAATQIHASMNAPRQDSPKFDLASGINADGESKVPPLAQNGVNGHASSDHESGEAVRDGSSIRRVPADPKKEVRAFDGYNPKEWSNAPRGSKRNGRGRGGMREYTNGHLPNPGMANGHNDFAVNGYGIPPSPSPTAYQTPRGPYGFTQSNRGTWQRGNARSQSIPVENGYAGGRSYWPQHQLPTMQTYYPGMYDYHGLSLSAMSYNPMMEQQYLLDMVTTQLEYYFSIDNLLKDMFLRKNMDSKGFVLLDVIANFNRIKHLTSDKELLKLGCTRSEHVEIRVGEDGKERLRRREGWNQFLLPIEQRELSAQNEGPAVLQYPEPPILPFNPSQASLRGSGSASLSSSQRKSYDSGYSGNGGASHFTPFSPLSEAAFGQLGLGEELRGRTAKSPIRDVNIDSNKVVIDSFLDPQDQEADVFPNEHLSTLTVLVKMKQHYSTRHQAASRTFSNGSIDTRNIFNELEKPSSDVTHTASKGEHPDNGKPTESSRHASPSQGRSPEKDNAGPDIYWVRGKELPQENLPQGTTLENYLSLRDKALGQREEAATGTCPYDLDVLYQFWSHFLIRNFNRRVYGEFKFYAHNDAQSRHSAVGLQNLVQFYSQALASTIPIRDSTVRDYVDLVNDEPTILQGAARKQLRQAWRNGALNLKNRKKLADIIDDTLKHQLES